MWITMLTTITWHNLLEKIEGTRKDMQYMQSKIDRHTHFLMSSTGIREVAKWTQHAKHFAWVPSVLAMKQQWFSHKIDHCKHLLSQQSVQWTSHKKNWMTTIIGQIYTTIPQSFPANWQSTTQYSITHDLAKLALQIEIKILVHTNSFNVRRRWLYEMSKIILKNTKKQHENV